MTPTRTALEFVALVVLVALCSGIMLMLWVDKKLEGKHEMPTYRRGSGVLQQTLRKLRGDGELPAAQGDKEERE